MQKTINVLRQMDAYDKRRNDKLYSFTIKEQDGEREYSHGCLVKAKSFEEAEKRPTSIARAGTQTIQPSATMIPKKYIILITDVSVWPL